MNESHPIDDLFRGRLKEYEMSPPKQLWDAIEQKRRPKPAFWWLRKNGLLLGIGLLVIALAGLLLFRSLSTPTPALQHFPVYLQQENTTANLQTQDLDESQKLSILPSPSKQSGTNTATPSLPSTTDESNQLVTNSNDYSTNVQGDAPQVASTPPPSTDVSPSATQQQPALLNNKQEIAEAAGLPPEENTHYTRTSMEAFSSLASSALTPLQSHDYVEEQATWPVWTAGNGNGITYYMEAFGSPGFASRSLTPANETFSFLTQEWENAQQQQSALQFGLRLAGVNRKGWSLRTGFHFTQIQESFDFVQHTAEIEQIYDPDGGFVREDTIFVPSGVSVSSQNEYALLDVPLILGYQKRFQRWTVSAQAGPIFNLSFQPKGTLINPNRQLVAIETPEARSAFRSTLGVNWYAGLGLQYEIQPGVHLMLEPHLRFQQRSFMEAGFPVQQQFLTGGVSVGVRKQIIR
jgi:hypothetical protein